VKDKFFEGADFEGKFKALIPKYYPAKYQQYIREERALLRKRVRGTNRIMEAGVGIGRLIPPLAPLVKKLVGVDNSNLMLKESQRVASHYKNVEIRKLNLETLAVYFPNYYFDYSLCVWNTLGNVQNEVRILKNLRKITKRSIFITVYSKGTLKDRQNWYKTVGIKIKRVDKKDEIFYSNSGLKSKSYSKEDIEKIALKAGLKVRQFKVLGGVILWSEMVSR